MSTYDIHIRPWLSAGRHVLPHRSILTTNREAERAMNVLGLKISVDRDPSARTKWTRRAGVLMAANAIVFAGGSAYAFWSANGSGTGSATAGSASGVNGNVTTVSSSSSLLVPGGSVPLVVNVHNPNSFAVKISAVTLTNNQVPSSVGGSPKNSTTCTAAASAVTLNSAASQSGLTQSITAGGDATVSLTNAVSMGTGSDDGCQNASFTFTTGVSVTAAS
jgi:hypothetical protein